MGSGSSAEPPLVKDKMALEHLEQVRPWSATAWCILDWTFLCLIKLRAVCTMTSVGRLCDYLQKTVCVDG